jgi:hypothetical protein
VRVRQIGEDVGRKGMKDKEIVPLTCPHFLYQVL